MGIFCDRLKFGFTAGQNKGRYRERELLLLLILLIARNKGLGLFYNHFKCPLCIAYLPHLANLSLSTEGTLRWNLPC